MRTYRIALDAAFDLNQAGQLRRDETGYDAKLISLFESAYEQAAMLLYGNKVEVVLVTDLYSGPETYACDSGDEVTEMWQAIHDEVDMNALQDQLA